MLKLKSLLTLLIKSSSWRGSRGRDDGGLHARSPRSAKLETGLALGTARVLARVRVLTNWLASMHGAIAAQHPTGAVGAREAIGNDGLTRLTGAAFGPPCGRREIVDARSAGTVVVVAGTILDKRNASLAAGTDVLRARHGVEVAGRLFAAARALHVRAR